MAKALIKLTQGISDPPAGEALVGVLSTPVVATNAVDTSDIKSWTWTLVDVPPGSSVPLGVVAMGNTPSISVVPDLRGGYHLELEVLDKSGRASVHRTVFLVSEVSGRQIPPFGATDKELNFAGGLRGWSPIMEAWLHYVDTLGGGSTPSGSGFVHITGGSQDGTARAVNLATGDVTGVAPVANRAAPTAAETLAALATAAGSVAVNSQKITQVATPTVGTDGANKAYVDAVAAGLVVKASCRLATAAALPTNTFLSNVLTGTSTGTLTVDGTLTALGDRLLVKNEVTGANNGIYTVTTAGAIGVAYVLTRATDANTSAEVTSGMFTFVEAGSANIGLSFALTTPDPITLNTTALAFSPIGGAVTSAVVVSALAGAASDIAINTHKITGLVAGTSNGHAVEYAQMNAAIAAVSPISFGTFASRNGATTQEYVSTGPGRRRWVFDGSIWRPVTLHGLGTQPPDASGWTWVNPGTTSTVADSGEGSLKLFVKSGNSTGWRYLQRTMQGSASSAYVMGIVRVLSTTSAYAAIGVGLAESGTGKHAVINLGRDDRERPLYISTGYGDASSSAAYTDYTAPIGPDLVLRVHISAGNVIWDVSADGGVDWLVIRTVAVTTVFTTAPDRVTVHTGSFYALGDFNGDVISWEQGDVGGPTVLQ